MTRRLLLSYLGLAVLILLVLEVPFGFIAARHESSAAQAEAGRDAVEIAIGSSETLEHGNRPALQSLVNDYFAHTGAEVTVTDASGRPLAVVDPDRDDDVRSYARLVTAALHGHMTTAIVSDESRPAAVAAVPVGPARHPQGVVLMSVPVTIYTDRTQDVWTALALFGVGVLFLTTLVGLGLARSLSRPLAVLEAAVARFGSGDLSSRVSSDLRPQEMASLAESFNAMAQRLEGLVNAQSQFVADASHQLRSPLTALRLRLENLEAELEPEAADAVVAVGREVQRLTRLVDGLLALSRADGSGPEPQPVDVAEVVTERCEAWSALAAERLISLDRSIPGEPAVALLVPGDLDQIIDNFLANALDAAPSESRIHVSVVPVRRDRLEVHVVDEGPGMSEADRSRAFDRFWQGPGQRGGHSGLGLAIVRQLAQRNGAEARLQAAAPGGLDAVVVVRSSDAASAHHHDSSSHRWSDPSDEPGLAPAAQGERLT